MEEKARILIAEDDEPARRFLKEILEKKGYEVLTAGNGVEALAVFQKNDVRLVIADWTMPAMGGVELCRAIRQRAALGYVYIIIAIEGDPRTDMVEALNAGADDCVLKPYGEGELVARLRTGARVVLLEQELSGKWVEPTEAGLIMQNDFKAVSSPQTSLVPNPAPEVPGIRFSWFSRPYDVIGGDKFNYFAINEEYLALYLLDVSGHGVPAAIMSVTLSRILSPNTKRKGISYKTEDGLDKKKILSPQEVVQLLNRQFPMDDDVGQYFTILYAIIHVPTFTMKIVKAGHPYLTVLRRKGNVEFVRKAGLPVGMFESAEFLEESMEFIPGDRIFIFSDGIVEAANSQGEAYGFDRLSEVLKSNQTRDIDEITDSILEDVLSHIGYEKIRDDMTLVGVSFDR